MSEETIPEEEFEEETLTESVETSLPNQQEIEHIVEERLAGLQEERAAGRRRMEYIKFAILAVILLGTVFVIALLKPTIFDRIVPSVMGQTSSSADDDAGNPGETVPAGEVTPGANNVQNLPVIVVPGNGGQDSGGQDSGGQDSGGQDSGGQDSGGQDSGGQDSGGQDSGEQDSGEENTGSAEPTAVPAQIYVVQPGDTLNSIARQFNSTVGLIVAANAIQNPDALQVGTTLTIPQPSQ